MKLVYFLYLIFLTAMMGGCEMQPPVKPATNLSYVNPVFTLSDSTEKENKITIKLGEKKYLREVLNKFENGVYNDFFESQFEWNVGDPHIASISYDYYLYANSPGETNLTGKRNYSGNFFTVKVSVLDSLFCRYVKLSNYYITIKVGEIVKVDAIAQMSDDSTNSNIFWENVDERICKVDSDGNIVGLSPGKTSVIAAYALDPKVKNIVKINVKK